MDAPGHPYEHGWSADSKAMTGTALRNAINHGAPWTKLIRRNAVRRFPPQVPAFLVKK